MRTRWPALGALFALSLFLSGDEVDDTLPARSTQNRLIESVPARCDVGARPDYFVPSDSPPALIGCARLGVSGKRVEFSASLDRIGRRIHLCINPAYSGRGQRGIFIPALCKLDPPPSRFAVRDVRQPRQGVRRYELVIWGTTDAATSAVVARFNSGRARAAVFKVPSRRVPWSFGEPSPFRVFVFELPLSAACGSVIVRAGDATERIPSRRRLCARASR